LILRPFSLQFFKTLLKTSFLRLALAHVCSQLIFSSIPLKVFFPQACTVPSLFSSLKAWCYTLANSCAYNLHMHNP
jgi:hypothetical protein